MLFEKRNTHTESHTHTYIEMKWNSFIIHITADKQCRFAFDVMLWENIFKLSGRNRDRLRIERKKNWLKQKQKQNTLCEKEFAFEWHSRNTWTLNKLLFYSFDKTTQLKNICSLIQMRLLWSKSTCYCRHHEHHRHRHIWKFKFMFVRAISDDFQTFWARIWLHRLF